MIGNWRGQVTLASMAIYSPLEPVAEAEPVTPDLALRVELGEALESLIDQQLNPASIATAAKDGLRARYPLPASTDPSATTILSACAGRVLDGVALHDDLAKGDPPT
jgi:hypothetical protein